MKTADFDFTLPEELIAQTPQLERDQSRLLVLDKSTGETKDRKFYDIFELLNPGDLLILNNTKVMPANLIGFKEEGGGKVEILFVRNLEGNNWLSLMKPAKRVKVGSIIKFKESDLTAEVIEKLESGETVVRFSEDVRHYAELHGEIPLPPYIKSSKEEYKDRYQTVYAQKYGASAAPTAGLHFTDDLLAKLKAKGVLVEYLTLHTGLGTFKPVYAENIKDHKMHSEEFEISAELLAKTREAKRVVAVGTTTLRVLETIASRNLLDSKEEISGETDIFIYPGFQFKVVDALITNFHTPKSTLLMLVSAFAGKDNIFNAYKYAINEKYRFFSFGDAMFIG